ncbi:UDP-glucuronosyl/UDP-glucosyltransferase [Dillenia turbinata]|uniref:Glycosyltransferase n=1 Tax=Dillenia turbinata TaxID=194707 RepID=A0AAN8ZD79_9MAGN
METKENGYSVLMLPWLAHGHISPFLELGKQLTKRNFFVYLCSTPINLSSIKNKITSKYSHSIQLVELILPTLPDLPPHYHTTNGLPPHLMPTLKEAFDLAKDNFSKIVKSLNPDLVVYDFLQPWAPAIASSYGIPAVLFVSAGAAASSFMYSLSKDTDFPFPSIYMYDFERERMSKRVQVLANGLKDADRVFQCNERSSKMVLIKSFKEIEGKYINYHSMLTNKKVVPVGPLVQDVVEHDEKKDISQWLDDKEESSVVFVSFGSEYFLTHKELEETAYGLELSKVSFIWVVRFPIGENIKLEEALPQGFLERVGQSGMVLEGWAPQRYILGHSSVGGFVSHCGWSSIMETMNLGVPIIAMPIHLDQPFNARLIEEVGVGLELKRDNSGRLQREEVAKVIREVMVGESGKNIKRKAKELSETMLKKGEEEIDLVVDELVQLFKEGK